MFSKVIVYGAGAIGSLYGAFLSEVIDTEIIGREMHVKAINENGLKVRGETEKTYNVDANPFIQEIPENALLILTMKANDVLPSLLAVEELLKEDTVILCMQNGLGIKDEAREVAGKCNIVRGITTFGAIYERHGEIFLSLGGENMNQTLIQEGERSSEILELFNKAGLNAGSPENFNEVLWKKLLINCVVNPLTGLLEVRNDLLSAEELDGIRNSIIKEFLEVAGKEGIHFDFDAHKYFEEFESRNVSSMLQDLRKGKETEIDYLNWKICELGKKHSVETPVNDAVVSLIRFKESLNKNLVK